MKVNLDVPDDLLKPVIEDHLSSGRSVQSYINDALSLYNKLSAMEKEGEIVGHSRPSSRSNFANYNTVIRVRRDHE